jgi:futalosine hydrolase
MRKLYVYAAPLEGDGIAARLPEALRLGVGKTAAAISLTERLATGPRPELVVAFGVCGAFPAEHSSGVGPQLDVLSLCLVADDLFADEGVETPERFVSLPEISLGSIGPYFADESENSRVAKLLGEIPCVRAATVSTCSGTDTSSITTAWRTGAAIETMEGAAIAAVCERFSVPWIQLRCVSNRTGDRSRGAWQLEEAAARLRDAVLRIV